MCPAGTQISAAQDWTGSGWQPLAVIEDGVPVRAGGRWVMILNKRDPQYDLDGTFQSSSLEVQAQSGSSWAPTDPVVVSGGTTGFVGGYATTIGPTGELMLAFAKEPAAGGPQLGFTRLVGTNWSATALTAGAGSGACTTTCVLVANTASVGTLVWSTGKAIKVVRSRM